MSIMDMDARMNRIRMIWINQLPMRTYIVKSIMEINASCQFRLKSSMDKRTMKHSFAKEIHEQKAVKGYYEIAEVCVTEN